MTHQLGLLDSPIVRLLSASLALGLLVACSSDDTGAEGGATATGRGTGGVGAAGAGATAGTATAGSGGTPVGRGGAIGIAGADTRGAAAGAGTELTDVSDLSERDTCGFVYATASSEDDTAALRVSTDALDEEPLGVPFDRVFDADDSDVSVLLQFGANLTAWDCTDAIVPETEPVVDVQMVPVSGTVRFTGVRESHEPAWPGSGTSLDTGTVTITLENVVFRRDGYEDQVVRRLQFTEVAACDVIHG